MKKYLTFKIKLTTKSARKSYKIEELQKLRVDIQVKNEIE